MKSFGFLVITFILYQKATADVVPPRDLCPKKNDEYSKCGTSCPLTCDNHRNPPKVCSKECVRGCVCKFGFVRNSAGDCVLPRDCPPDPKCPLHEEYSRCATACPLTCRNHLNPPKFCTLQCVTGCHCEKGYVRNETTRRCVLPSECPRNCRQPNEEYNKCGSACPETCENFKKPRPCIEKCVAGCFCKPGFLRNKDNRCVLPRECFLRRDNQ